MENKNSETDLGAADGAPTAGAAPTDEKKKQKGKQAANVQPATPNPDKVTLASPYAFYEDNGDLRNWAAGAVVTDADEIAVLIDRQAPLAEFPESC